MGMQRHVLAVIAVTAVGVGALSGCGLLPRSTFSDDAVLTDEITAVRLHLGNGSLTVRGTDAAAGVALARTVSYRGSRPTDPTYQVEDGVLVLGDCGRNCDVSYTVDLPAGLPVTGESSNGAITLSGVGQVDVRTSNGAITVDGADGAVSARTSNGRIEITLTVPQGVTAQTSNGAIGLTVPEGSYRVSANTRNGSVDLGIPDDPAGEHRLDLSTSNGSITVRPA